MLIAGYKTSGAEPPILAALYFGIPIRKSDGSENHDSEYKDTVTAISSQTDDVIFFSKMLCSDLERHGERLLKEYKGINKKTEIEINSVRFGEAEVNGLIPSDDNYKSWVNWDERVNSEKTKEPAK